MSYCEILVIGVGLSMDAFAVAVCKGLNMRKLNLKQGTVIALFFGVFQAGMPLLGWLLGKQFQQYITKVDHWIVFILLTLIGGNMIREAIKGEEECEDIGADEALDIKELTILAIATSIDALAIGITFAFLQVNIVPAVTLIGVITFVIALTGVVIGNYFGVKYKEKAEFAGGIILVLMGIKILLEHLGILSF